MVGYSEGAFTTQKLVCEAADLFAGMATVSATMPASVAENCMPATEIPILMIHGTDDYYHFDVYREAFDSCPLDAEVILYRLEGAGYGWPDAGFSASFEKTARTRDRRPSCRRINSLRPVWLLLFAPPAILLQSWSRRVLRC